MCDPPLVLALCFSTRIRISSKSLLYGAGITSDLKDLSDRAVTRRLFAHFKYKPRGNATTPHSKGLLICTIFQTKPKCGIHINSGYK